MAWPRGCPRAGTCPTARREDRTLHSIEWQPLIDLAAQIVDGYPYRITLRQLHYRLLTEGPVSWEGSVRPPLVDQQVYPKTASGSIRTWVGVGGSPESVVRAAHYEFPLVLAIIGGEPARFKPYVDLYKRALAQMGHDTTLPVAVHSPGFIAATDDEAVEGVRLLARTEGILPALEPAHAVAALGGWLAGTTALEPLADDAIVLLGLSGRGDKDLAAIADRIGA